MLSKLYLNQIRGTQGNTLEKLKLCFSLLQSPCCTNLELIYFHSDCLSSPLSSPGLTRQLENSRQFSNRLTEWPDRRLEEGPHIWPWWCPRPRSPPLAPGPLCCSLSQRRFAHPQSESTKQKKVKRLNFINKIYLKTPELFLFTPIIKGSDENYDYYSYEYCKSFNPIGTVIVNLLWKIKEC